jgi:hypothetical protein
MEQFLINFPDLKHLELVTHASETIANGYRWAMLVHGLISFKFHFKLEFIPISIDNILSSFLTPFWLEEKHWFVMCDTIHLSSLPDLVSSSTITYQSNLPIFSTAPDTTLIYDHINEIIVTKYFIQNGHYLSKIKTLELTSPMTADMLSRSMDLNEIKHLHVLSIDWLLAFIPLEYTMRQVDKLTVRDDVQYDTIRRLHGIQIKQIRKLQIGISGNHTDCIMEELFSLFPCTQSLVLTSYIRYRKHMGRFVDGFQSLSNASFRAVSTVNDNVYYRYPCKIFRHSRRVLLENFVYKVRSSYLALNSSCRISWWIENQVSHLNKIKLLIFFSFI